jgi:hypothetical protein
LCCLHLLISLCCCFFFYRALYNAGYRTVASIAQATTEEIARIVGLATPFRSKKQASQVRA